LIGAGYGIDRHRLQCLDQRRVLQGSCGLQNAIWRPRLNLPKIHGLESLDASKM
jgi:hypothetical protein